MTADLSDGDRSLSSPGASAGTTRLMPENYQYLKRRVSFSTPAAALQDVFIGGNIKVHTGRVDTGGSGRSGRPERGVHQT
jgi:hypothetical protein